jgi:hypothetical protein
MKEKASTITKKAVGGKIADRLKAFEPPKDAVVPPPSPPPVSPPKEEKDKKKSSLSKSPATTSKSTSTKKDREVVEEKSASPKKSSSKSKELPGSFPDDEPIDILDMPIDKKSSKKSKTATKESASPKEVKAKSEPVVAAPLTPPPEPKSSKKERPKVVRDGGSSWGSWGATPRKDEKEKEKDKKSSKSRKPDDSPPKDEKKSKDSELKRSKSARKPSEKDSSKDSSSDKAEKESRPPVSRGLSAMFGTATPLARSKSVTERRSSMSGKTSSRRQSVADGSGIISPPPEMSAKAAKLLGVTPGKLARSKSERQSKPRGILSPLPQFSDKSNFNIEEDDDEDLIMIDAINPEKSSRDRKGKSKVFSDPKFKPPPAVPMPPGDNDLPIRRKRVSTMDSDANARTSKQTKQDDDIVMVDAGGPSDAPGLKRSDSSAKKAAGGIFGGLLGKSRPDNKRRSTALTDDEGVRGLRREDRKIKRPAKERTDELDRDVTMSGGAADEDQEARREARRARKAEKEAADKAADEARRAKDEERRERRRKQEEEAEAKLREEKEARRAARREQKARDDEERIAAESKEAERAERRRARRAERDTQTDGELLAEEPTRLRKSDRRKSHMDQPADEDEERRRRREERRLRSSDAPRTSRRKSAPIVDEQEYLPAEGPVYKDSKKKAAWPHSGTDSWVQDHSDAPPPPEDTPPVEISPVDDTIADENARRNLRKTRRHSRYGDDGAEDHEERRRRRDSRRGETIKSSEGSQDNGRRASRKDSAFVDSPRAPSSGGGLFSRFKKIAGV